MKSQKKVGDNFRVRISAVKADKMKVEITESIQITAITEINITEEFFGFHKAT